jgi:hypothetical protein
LECDHLHTAPVLVQMLKNPCAEPVDWNGVETCC